MNLLAREHLQEWFIKINPQHTVPTLDDNGKIIWESSVICTYLIDAYAKDDTLYPKDLYERAKCNQRLHFTDGILYQRLRNCSSKLLKLEEVVRFCANFMHFDYFIKVNYYLGGVEVPESQITALDDAYKFMEAFLVKDTHLLGNHLTVADLCAVGLIGSMDAIYLPIDAKQYPRLHNWLERMKKEPYYEELEGKYIRKYKQMLADIKAKNESAKKA